MRMRPRPKGHAHKPTGLTANTVDLLNIYGYPQQLETFPRLGETIQNMEHLLRLTVDLAYRAIDLFVHDLQNSRGHHL